MKNKIAIVAILFLVISTSAFAQDYKKAIVGTWKFAAVNDSKSEKVSKKMHRKAKKNEAKIQEAKSFDEWAIGLRNKFTNTVLDFNESMSVVITTTNADGKTKTQKVTYTVVGKKLTINMPDESVIFTIQGLAEKQLRLDMDLSRLVFVFDKTEKAAKKKLLPAKK